MNGNMSLKIDAGTHDLVFDETGILVQTFGDETTTQAVRLTLESWKGEFPFDPAHGTDYERIMGKKQHELEEDEVEEVLREAILQETDVEQIDELTSNFDGREIGLSFSGTLTSGETITAEVKTK